MQTLTEEKQNFIIALNNQTGHRGYAGRRSRGKAGQNPGMKIEGCSLIH